MVCFGSRAVAPNASDCVGKSVSTTPITTYVTLAPPPPPPPLFSSSVISSGRLPPVPVPPLPPTYSFLSHCKWALQISPYWILAQQQVDEDDGYWRQKSRHENLAWAHNLAHVILQSAQCFTNAMVGPRSWIGGLLYRSSNKRNGHGDKILGYTLSPLQEQRLQRLQERLQVPFDETRPDHQEALRALWKAAFPNVVLTGLISDQWKDMGWQGPNPSTDFRGCGFISLENLLFFARTYPVIVQEIWEACNLGIPVRCCRH